jgi:glutaconyl-CoA/methylmalonyl-CoA decarboxylase subunit gamma
MTTTRAAIIAAVLRQAVASGERPPGIRSAPGQEEPMRHFRVTVDGHPYEVSVEEVPEPAPAPAPIATAKAPAEKLQSSTPRGIQAPMPGRILEVRVGPGTAVSSESVVVVLEAMKMEIDILAGTAGNVAAVHVQAGDTVNTGDTLVEMDA